MFKRALSFILISAVLCALWGGIPLEASAAGRYALRNSWVATGADIIEEARNWAGTGAVYRSGVTPWEDSVKWRTGYADDGVISFDCSGFVGRVLNDCGFRGSTYTPSYGYTVLSQTYKRGYIGISIEELVNYGADISDAVEKARDGDYSGLRPGDVIGWTGGTLGRHVIFYAGLNDGVPWMVEMTGRGLLDRAVTPEYQAHFQYGARFASSAGDGPLTQCTYPAHCKLAVTEDQTKVMSLPATGESDTHASVLALAYRNEPAYVATALIRNEWNELWYKIKTREGETGYLYAGDAEYLGQIVDLHAEDITVPSNHRQGESYSLSGSVTAVHSHLTNVSLQIYIAEDRGGVSLAGASLAVTGSRYSLSGSAIDRQTAFGSLTTGRYVCLVSGSYINYYAATPDTLGINTGNGTVFEAVFSVSAVPVECEHAYVCEELIPADCEVNGMTRYTCHLCGFCYTESVSVTGHDYLEEKIPATVREDEKICYTCQNCRDTCTRYTGVTYLPGDIDCSGKVNTDDAVMLLLHISMPELYPAEPEAADLDGSGAATTEDVVLLLLHISMPDMYPL